MAFVLRKGSTYRWPVKFETPADGGKYDKQVFDVEFKRLPDSRIKEVLNNESAKDTEFAREIMTGWAGIKDESGNEVPFSEHALTELFEVPGLAGVIVKTYLESLAGAKAKN